MAKEEVVGKKKIPWGTIFILAILLILLGLFLAAYVQDESQLGVCEAEDECGRYNVFYIKGSGYVCASDAVMGQNSIKNRILMFKYASQKAIDAEPSGCSCVESQCEVS